MSSEPDYPQRAFQLPEDATELLLVRHGASAAAVEGQPFELVDGHGNPPLAPEGERQAAAVAERLADEPLTGLFVTTLQRTAQTAAPLVERTGMAPVVIPELREIHLGDWEGGEFRIRFAQGDPVIGKLFAEERWDAIPGAESMESFGGRVRAGIESVVATAGPGVRVAVFAHSAVISEICHQATSSRPFAFLLVGNGSITRLVVFADGRWMLRSFNESGHLPARVD